MGESAFPTRYWLWIAPLVVAVAFIWLLGSTLTPFVIAAAFAYIGDPFVDRLETFHLPRTAAVLAVFILFTIIISLLVLLLFPLLEQQVRTFIDNIPRYAQWIQARMQPVLATFLPKGQDMDVQSLRELIAQHWSAAGGFVTAAFKRIFSSGSVLITLLVNLVMIPVITFYMLRDWDHLITWLQDQLPRRVVATVTSLARETDQVLGQFVRGQLLVMSVLGLIYVVGLYLAGLELAVLIGIGAGLISFVPYLGVIVGVLTSAIAMLVQTGGDWWSLVWIAVIFGIGQIMESMVLQPLLLGDRIGLHPVTVIFAVLAGGHLFGFVGVLVALPVAAAIAVFVRFAGRRWRASRLYLEDDGAAE